MLNRHARLAIVGMWILFTVIMAAAPDAAIGDGLNVFLYSGGSVTQITNDNNGRNARINDLGHLVWKTTQFPANICYYNGIIYQVPNSYGYTPDISNSDKIVFAGAVEGKAGICLYDGVITSNIIEGTGWAPRINDSGLIVYEDSQSSSEIRKIRLYDNGNIIDIAANAYNSYPDINSKGQIVWAGYDGTNHRIYLADPNSGYSPTVITPASYGKYPNINDIGQIIYAGGDGAIYLWDKGETTKIADQGNYPDINNLGQIVYKNNDQVYLYQNRVATNISNNNRDNHWPFINNNGQVVWYSSQPKGKGIPPIINLLLQDN
jgi:hypothetical protein